MRTNLMLLAALASCTTTTTAIPPDAASIGVHDQLITEACDVVSWGAPVNHCEHACLTKPVDPPCHGMTPCNDVKGCMGAATTRGEKPVDCASTFLVSDYAGLHQGCCQIRLVPTDPSYMIPTFYECPR